MPWTGLSAKPSWTRGCAGPTPRIVWAARHREPIAEIAVRAWTMSAEVLSGARVGRRAVPVRITLDPPEAKRAVAATAALCSGHAKSWNTLRSIATG